MIDTAATATAVAAVIRAHRFRWSDEDRLQAGVAAALMAAGFWAEREVRLNSRDRIDLLVDRVGIEVKVDGAAGSVRRQIVRYLDSDMLDELVLVTTRVRHTATAVGDPVDGKHVEIVQLAGAGL